MKNPIFPSIIFICALFAVFTLYQVILNIAAIVGGIFIGSAITIIAIKRPRVETRGHKDLIDLQEQINTDINR